MMMRHPNRETLIKQGIDLARRFCDLNAIEMPQVVENLKAEWPFDACAYYRPVAIQICVPLCAWIGTAGRAWSYPGYVVDRTPYGVIQHELGHHVDYHRGKRPGAYWSDYSQAMRAETREPPITSYCPNHAEWFAEIFRLFVTNPDLLRLIRPRTYARLLNDGFKPVFTDDWRAHLDGAPQRTIDAAANKIAQAAKPKAARRSQTVTSAGADTLPGLG